MAWSRGGYKTGSGGNRHGNNTNSDQHGEEGNQPREERNNNIEFLLQPGLPQTPLEQENYFGNK